MNAQELTKKIIELQSARDIIKKEYDIIDKEIEGLKYSLLGLILDAGEKGKVFDFGKATIVQTEKLQIVDEPKLILKLTELGLHDEYVQPRVNNLFNAKEFFAKYPETEGIAKILGTPYVRVTSVKDDTK